VPVLPFAAITVSMGYEGGARLNCRRWRRTVLIPLFLRELRRWRGTAGIGVAVRVE
jgi:hypothetical protein